MKENNDLDKHFRNGLKDLETGPPDGTKSSMEKQLIDAGMLKEKNDSRGGLWLFALLALLLITPLVIMVSKKSKHTKQVAEQTTVKNDSLNSLKNEVNKSTGSPHETQQAADEWKNTTVTHQATSSTQMNKEKRINLKGNSESSTSIEAQAANGVTTMVKEKKSRKRKEKNEVEKNQLNMTDASVAAKDVNAGTKEKTGKETPAVSETVSAAHRDSSVIADATAASKNEKPAEKDSLLKKPAKDSTAKSKSPPIVEKNLTDVAFDFSGGPQFNSFQYGSGAIIDNQTYIEQARQSEKTTPSFSAAFGIVLSFNHLVVETGIRHSSLSSDFSYSESYYRIDTSGSVPDTIRGETHYLATNNIAFLEFPILLGYNFRASKFRIEVKSGVLVGYITSANTTIFSLNSGDVVKYDNLENSPYSKTFWSYLGAANILYPLGGRFSVFVQPSLKLGLNSLFKDNYAVTKKIQSTTVGIGLRVEL